MFLINSSNFFFLSLSISKLKNFIPPNNDNLSVGVVELKAGGVALVVLNDIKPPKDLSDNVINASKQRLANNYSRFDFDAVVTSINSNADIIINNKLLEQ